MAGSVATTVTSTTRSRVHGLDEQLSTLGKATESLLRTARLDTVLIARGEEELRAAVADLEDRWKVYEQMVEEEREVEQYLADNDGASVSDSAGPSEANQSRRSSLAARRCSSIDWEDGGVGESLKSKGQSNLDWGGMTNSVATDAPGRKDGDEEVIKDDKPWWRFGDKKEVERSEQSDRPSWFGGIKKDGLQADATADRLGSQRTDNSVGSALSKLFSPKRPPDVDQSSSEPPGDEEKRTSELEETAALRLKLKTRDSAAESLQQLVTMQVGTGYGRLVSTDFVY